MLTLWRRHNPKHCKLQGREERKCRCPIWISGVDDSGTRVKETTKLRDWTKAEALARHWDNTGAKPAQTQRVTIEDWKKAFLADAESPAGKTWLVRRFVNTKCCSSNLPTSPTVKDTGS